MRSVPPLPGRRRFLASALGSLVVARAGTLNSEDTQRRELEVMGNPYNQSTYRALASSFAAATRERLNVTFGPREGEEVVRSLLLRAFTKSPLPDVVFLNADVIRTFVERNLLAPLDSLLQKSGASAMRSIQVGQSAYGIALGLSVPIVAFNASLVRRVGHDPKHLPRDWAAVLDLARKIRAAAPEAIGGFIEHDNGGAFTFQYLLQSFGGRPMSADETRVGFDSPAGLQAMQVLRGFGECGQAAVDMSRRQARRAFAGGRIGVLVTMSSVIPYLESTSAGAFGVTVTPLPLANVNAHVPAAGPVAVLFTKDADRQRRAWRFLQHAAGPKGQAILVSTSGYLPAGELPASVQSQSRPLSSLVEPRRVTPWYTFPGRNSLKISEFIQDQMQQVATLQKPPEAALRDIVRSVEALLARRG
jgi:multiple sugar transport system substrate-binding protein